MTPFFRILTSGLFCTAFSTCTRLPREYPTADSEKNPVSHLEEHTKKPKHVTPNTAIWPESWKKHHQRFNDYVEARMRSWPQPEIKFQKPDHLTWQASAPEKAKYGSRDTTDGIQYFRHGRPYLNSRDDGTSSISQSFSTGDYAASVWRSIEGYQHLSPPFYFRVISGENENGDRSEITIEPFQAKFDGELFPNQWWYYHTDFHIWDTSDSRHSEFFKTPRPFKPAISLEEAQGSSSPIVERNLLSPKLEKLLELRLYYEGKLMKTGSISGTSSWTFDYGPGHYVFLIVAPDDDGGVIIVARPFQTWFPDEGDGILRLVPLDTDKDGIPDYWEKWYDLDPKDPTDAKKKYSGMTYLGRYMTAKKYNRTR